MEAGNESLEVCVDFLALKLGAWMSQWARFESRPFSRAHTKGVMQPHAS